MEFRTRRRQATQEQAKQALTAVIVIQLAPNVPEKSGGWNSNAIYSFILDFVYLILLNSINYATIVNEEFPEKILRYK